MTWTSLDHQNFWKKQEKIMTQCNLLSPYNVQKGPREFVLAHIYFLLNEVQQDQPDDALIESAARSISSISHQEAIPFFYKHIVAYKNNGVANSAEQRKQIHKFITKKNHKKHLFNDAERLLIRQVAVGIVTEYMLLEQAHHRADYGMMKIQLEFLQEVLETGIPVSPLPNQVEIFSDSGNRMVSWNITPHDKLVKFALHLLVNIEVHPMDHLENEYEILCHKYAYLDKESLHTLATAIAQEKMMSKSNQLLSYTGMTLSFLTVLERELKSILLSRGTNTEPKKLMWKRIIQHLTEEEILRGKENKEREWLEGLSNFNELRNRAAHGEFVTYEEYRGVKTFILQSGLLNWISEYRYSHNIDNTYRD